MHEFPDLDSIFAGYFRRDKEDRARSPVFVTDHAACPRKLTLRWSGCEPRRDATIWADLRARKFAEADWVSDQLGNALRWKGVAALSEVRISDLLPKHVGGRLDHVLSWSDFMALGGKKVREGNFIFEVKSPGPHFKEAYAPRPQDIGQVLAYHHYAKDALDLVADPWLIYAPAGGGDGVWVFSPSYEGDFDLVEEVVASLQRAVAHYEKWVADPSYRPPILPRRIDFVGATRIVKAPDYRCSKLYCEYAWTDACEPETGTTVIMEKKRGADLLDIEAWTQKTGDEAVLAEVSQLFADRARWRERAKRWRIRWDHGLDTDKETAKGGGHE